MCREAASEKRGIHKIFLFSIPVLTSFFLQSTLLFGEIQEGSLTKIQGYAIHNTDNKKNAKGDIIKLMGAFATSDLPVSQPISLKFEYTTFEKLYMGVVIINYSGNDKDVTVTFRLSGPRGGVEKEVITIPASSTYYAYIYDTLGRPGFYTFQGGVKDIGSLKVTMLFTEE